MDLADEIERKLSHSLFIYTGSYSFSYRRQVMGEDEFLESQSSNNFAVPSTTGVLQRYQLLTPALILALLTVLFLIIPLVLIAVNALTSIQIPSRMGSQQKVSHDKKIQ